MGNQSPEVLEVSAPNPAAGLGVELPAAKVSLGIMGKDRLPAIVVLLSIVTLGLYALIWHSRINREMSDFDTRMYVHSGKSTWAITIPWLLGLLATAAGILFLLSRQLNLTIPFNISAMPIAWFLLPGLLLVPLMLLLFPFSCVAVVMTAERVRICQDRIGITTDKQLRPAANAAWLLVPIIGGLVLMARLQIALNDVWERVAPAASSRGHY